MLVSPDADVIVKECSLRFLAAIAHAKGDD